jgi:hypothetical protein
VNGTLPTVPATRRNPSIKSSTEKVKKNTTKASKLSHPKEHVKKPEEKRQKNKKDFRKTLAFIYLFLESVIVIHKPSQQIIVLFRLSLSVKKHDDFLRGGLKF